MAKPTVADYLLERLRAWDVTEVFAYPGDGAMQMNGLAELITVKHYGERWTDPRLIVAVLHNDDLNQVTWEMRAMEGAPKFTESQTLPDVDYAAFATSLGLQGINVDKPADLGPAWEDTAKAILAGDENARSVIVEGIKTKVREFMPHSGD